MYGQHLTFLKVVYTKTRNQLKRAETSRNDPTPAKKIKKSCKTTGYDAKFHNWGNLELSTIFRFSDFQPKCSNLGILGQEILTFNFLTKFCLYLNSKVLILNLNFFFFKFWAQIPKFGHFVQKSINFLILTFTHNVAFTHFWMCWFQVWHWFSKILSPNPQIQAYSSKKHQLFNLNEIFPVPYFEDADFKSDICFQNSRAQIPKFKHFGLKSTTYL